MARVPVDIDAELLTQQLESIPNVIEVRWVACLLAWARTWPTASPPRSYSPRTFSAHHFLAAALYPSPAPAI